MNEQAVQGTYQKIQGSADHVHYRLTTPLVQVDRIYKLDADHYGVIAQVKVKNKSDQKAEIKVIGVTRGLQNEAEGGGSMFSPPLNLLSSICAFGEDLDRSDRSTLRSKMEDQEPILFEFQRL